jgi:hypothetical protein
MTSLIMIIFRVRRTFLYRHPKRARTARIVGPPAVSPNVAPVPPLVAPAPPNVAPITAPIIAPIIALASFLVPLVKPLQHLEHVLQTYPLSDYVQALLLANHAFQIRCLRALRLNFLHGIVANRATGEEKEDQLAITGCFYTRRRSSLSALKPSRQLATKSGGGSGGKKCGKGMHWEICRSGAGGDAAKSRLVIFNNVIICIV